MVNYFFLLLVIIIAIFLILLTIYPRFIRWVLNYEPITLWDRLKFFLLFILSIYTFFHVCRLISPPAEGEQNGYVYVLSDEPEEDIEMYGHRYVLKGGE